ncbi:hypothetical protein BDZ45DRAFT_749048 [Acephala macrosclerotiorum]|nr:hypothetical protein BDZ45DRAFT_749048 [Acephala macrosclerotiorum]
MEALETPLLHGTYQPPLPPLDEVSVLKTKFRETASELETARRMLYDCQIYYRSEVERGRAFQSGLNLQRQLVNDLRSRYHNLYAEQDRVNAKLRHQLRIAEQAIESQQQELARYATLPQMEQPEISRPDRPQYMSRGVDFVMEGGDIQHGIGPASETQLNYSAGDGQTSANIQNAPFLATELSTSAAREFTPFPATEFPTSVVGGSTPFPATEFPTSAVRDEPLSGAPVSEGQGQKRGSDGQGNPPAKKQRRSKQ